jgi:acetyl esterase/lipase
MLEYQIEDWDEAYSIEPHIVGGYEAPTQWAARAAAHRSQIAPKRFLKDIAYGAKPRNRMDVFLPEATPRGLVLFVHGGYWSEGSKDLWSQLAAGPLARGFAVALPSYTLCPNIKISGISLEIAAAVEAAAALVEGPIALTGHSAGGHLATRMVCEPQVLSDTTLGRIAHVVSISGIHDLRPIMRTQMNATLGLDINEATLESPALSRPTRSHRLLCWVGGAERSEFLRQNALLANIWTGLGCDTEAVVERDRHHFNVVDGLMRPDHQLVQSLLAPLG